MRCSRYFRLRSEYQSVKSPCCTQRMDCELTCFAVAEVTRLEDRPKLLGLFGAVFGGEQYPLCMWLTKAPS